MLVSLAVTPAKPTVAVGASQPFTATTTYSDATTKDLTSAVTWTSSTPATATINPSGVATAVGVGADRSAHSDQERSTVRTASAW